MAIHSGSFVRPCVRCSRTASHGEPTNEPSWRVFHSRDTNPACGNRHFRRLLLLRGMAGRRAVKAAFEIRRVIRSTGCLPRYGCWCGCKTKSPLFTLNLYFTVKGCDQDRGYAHIECRAISKAKRQEPIVRLGIYSLMATRGSLIRLPGSVFGNVARLTQTGSMAGMEDFLQDGRVFTA